ncbi:hypothetical protein NKH75_07210 [Mesorhizobium sp. M0984]|uniref:hypothetical protein n=1 Tax=Mesorhizobium sp. M0984 TaxID=2957041 RepID=UPI00333DF1A4
MKTSVISLVCVVLFWTFQAEAEAEPIQNEAVILAQDDGAAREAAQRELEESLRRDNAEQSRQDCERQKADILARCLSGATSVNLDCQKNCDSSISDGAEANECKRSTCSNVEASSHKRCYFDSMTISCS